MTDAQFCIISEVILIGLLFWCWGRILSSLQARSSAYIRRDSITIPTVILLVSLYLMYQTACYAGWI